MKPDSTSQVATVRKIQRLPDDLINQIAAGEVVERPASVVKELVENALDAGAKRIEVHLKDGGLEEIGVLDDGHGMGREDLELCLERHATSKLAEASDLEAIGTFGFRGEALSSIAAVSEMEIKTRQSGDSTGNRLAVAWGVSDGQIAPVGMAAGSCVVVRHLFHRIPARRKFMKSAATEFSHAARILREVAAANPQAAFFLNHNNRASGRYLAGNREARYLEIAKVDWKPMKVNEQNDDLRLEAYLSPPHLIQDRGELVFCVNRRPVKNRALIAAIRSAYLDTLGPHHDPSGVVFLDLRLDWVDVNVHPQKLEVRCLRQESIYAWLLQSVRKAIALARSIREMTPPRLEPMTFAEAPKVVQASWTPPALPQSLPTMEWTATPAIRAPSVERVSGPKQARFHYLGQIKASYLVCEDAEGVILVDQHALHEKLVFERLKKAQAEGRTQSQRLLVPKVIRLPTGAMELLEENKAALEKLGFECESFGDGDIAVKSRPECLKESEIEAVLKDILERLTEGKATGGDPLERALHPVLATVACHSVVRANQRLSPVEAHSLLEGLEEIEQGWTCPHGRPVLFRLSYQSIEKHFERT